MLSFPLQYGFVDPGVGMERERSTTSEVNDVLSVDSYKLAWCSPDKSDYFGNRAVEGEPLRALGPVRYTFPLTVTDGWLLDGEKVRLKYSNTALNRPTRPIDRF